MHAHVVFSSLYLENGYLSLALPRASHPTNAQNGPVQESSHVPAVVWGTAVTVSGLIIGCMGADWHWKH